MIKSIRSKAFSTLAMPGVALAIAGAMALAPQAAQASDGTITFSGKIITQTCTVSTGTAGSFTVTLPLVTADTASGNLQASGDTAGTTPFTISLTNCPQSPTGIQVASDFSGSNIITTGTYAGLLSNTGTATSVDLQLLNGDGTAIDLSGTGASGQGSKYYTIDTSGNATMSYEAQYYATGTAGAGTVSTTVDYTLVYQ